jgi:hypothetical protein
MMQEEKLAEIAFDRELTHNIEVSSLSERQKLGSKQSMRWREDLDSGINQKSVK